MYVHTTNILAVLCLKLRLCEQSQIDN